MSGTTVSSSSWRGAKFLSPEIPFTLYRNCGGTLLCPTAKSLREVIAHVIILHLHFRRTVSEGVPGGVSPGPTSMFPTIHCR